MNTSGKKFNIIDIIIIVSLILISTSAVLQRFAVNRFEENNTIEDTVITLRLLNIDDSVVENIEKGDYIFSDAFSNDESIGVVRQKLKHSLTNDHVTDNTLDKEIIEYEIQISAKCIKNNDEFYCLNNKKVVPGLEFPADNGFVGFDCEVISVKSVD